MKLRGESDKSNEWHSKALVEQEEAAPNAALGVRKGFPQVRAEA